ncbi:YjjI family glycine radical enzyme [Clostridium chrysemydis]|uniref:YjjI family glycine radical enzyme n=1 Tax=Clostridium chrysemydis TaxID=2665504 RepID=UPI003F36EACE
MDRVLEIIKDESLTYAQRVKNLACYAENTIEVLNVDDETKKLMEDGCICNLFEGNAPYRPRYIIPDYRILMEKGCEFLNLDKPEDIWDATNNLLIFYKHVPSITSFPVYLGNIDELLEPFVKDEVEAKKAIKLFLKHIDRTLTDSFVHANIGPKETVSGRLILEAMDELQCAVPNLTMKYDIDNTSRDFINLCAKVALSTAKPSFANHKMDVESFKTKDYAIASCYNGFHIGGGGYTLVRIKLNEVAKKANSIEDFLDNVLPYVSEKMLAYIDERIRFLVDETPFFKTNFLVREGFIKKELFTGMFGVVGLAEAVNTLLDAKDKKDRFGYSKKADDLGLKIIEKLNLIVNSHKGYGVDCFDGHHVLHAQVGIDLDNHVSPGCRIPVGEEPEIFKHIMQSAPFHKYFFNGIGDIFIFEDTYNDHPEALIDIINGAFNSGIRYFSLYGKGADVIRVTGYLAKKSEVEKLKSGKAVLNNTDIFALGAKENCMAFDRKIRK